MIDKNTPIDKIVENFPELVRPLREYGIVCVQCGEPVWGTLGEQMEEKDISDQEKILAEMNKMIKAEE